MQVLNYIYPQKNTVTNIINFQSIKILKKKKKNGL